MSGSTPAETSAVPPPVTAVMDAAGAKRSAIFGSHEGCLMATLFAATYPENTVALALFVIDLTGSATDVGIVLAAYSLPLVVLVL